MLDGMALGLVVLSSGVCLALRFVLWTCSSDSDKALRLDVLYYMQDCTGILCKAI